MANSINALQGGEGYFLSAGVLYGIAKNAYERTKTAGSDTDQVHNDALVAITFSAATLEALVMEIAFHAKRVAQRDPHSPATLLALVLEELEASRGAPTAKYNLLLATLFGKQYDKGAQPFQDFHLLFRIRNDIIHLKPQVLASEPVSIVAALTNKGLCKPKNPHVHTSFISDISTCATARWACNVVSNMVQSIRECLPDDEGDAGLLLFAILEFATRGYDPLD